MESEIILSVGGFPPLSARGCKQEISPIFIGEFSRTVNGELIYVGLTEKKYKTTIECEDKNGIALDGIEIGMNVTVSCIQRFWQHIKPFKNLKNELKENSKNYFSTDGKNKKVDSEIFDLIEKTNLVSNFKKVNENVLLSKEKKLDVLLEKKPRKNSVFKMDLNKNIEDLNEKVRGKLIEKVQDDSEFFISYLPELEMKITNFKVSTTEWTQTTKWKIEMEEI